MGVFSSAVFSKNIARFLKFGDITAADLFCRPRFGSKVQFEISAAEKKSTHSSNNKFRLSFKTKKNVHIISHITNNIRLTFLVPWSFGLVRFFLRRSTLTFWKVSADLRKKKSSDCTVRLLDVLGLT